MSELEVRAMVGPDAWGIFERPVDALAKRLPICELLSRELAYKFAAAPELFEMVLDLLCLQAGSHGYIQGLNLREALLKKPLTVSPVHVRALAVLKKALGESTDGGRTA